MVSRIEAVERGIEWGNGYENLNSEKHFCRRWKLPDDDRSPLEIIKETSAQLGTSVTNVHFVVFRFSIAP